jgi:hypothetical protein
MVSPVRRERQPGAFAIPITAPPTASANMSDMRQTRTGASVRALLALVICCVAGTGVACGSTTTSPRLLSDTDNGHTVTVSRGTSVRLVLHSTYWTLRGSSTPSVVAVSGPPTYASRPGGVPGSGTGTVTETLRALAPGRAKLSASRLSCGEALRCRPDQGSYSVTIVVASR